MSNFPFPSDPRTTAATLAYRNTRLIADEALPRRKVGKIDFRYLVHTMAEGFTMPDTKVGRRSAPNEVTFTATEEKSSTEDFGLEDPIPQTDIDNAPEGYDPIVNSTMTLTGLIALGREIRVAGLLFDAAKYPTANKITLAGTSQFSDFVNSDPIGVIMTALDAPIMRPNTMVIGRAAYAKLVQHPKIVKAAFGNAGDSGVATREALARIFELDKVLVGEAFLNTAKKGQAATYSRVWGKHAALYYLENDGTRDTATFGFTAEYGNRIAGTFPDKNIGLRGGVRVRVGEGVKEVISAADLGYFIKDAVA